MADYLIGDVQGCFLSLHALLKNMAFKPTEDSIVFLGDAINRGPKSLETLRFIKANSSCMELLLGNHEIFALGIALGAIKNPRPHTLQALLNASDKDELIAYIRTRPLILRRKNNILVHAGILPSISINDAIAHAHHVSAILISTRAKKFLERFYEKTPTEDKPGPSSKRALRLTLAYLTLLRMCNAPNSMDLSYTSSLDKAPQRLKPWFTLRNDPEHIYFGHWAALGLYHYKNYHCLDTGCAWGNKLTALRLDDGQIFQVDNSDD